MSILSKLLLDDYQTPPEDVAAGEPVLTWRQRFAQREEGVAQSGYTNSSSYERYLAGGPYYEWGWSLTWTNWLLGVHFEVDAWADDPGHPRRVERVWATFGLGPLAWGFMRTTWPNGNPDCVRPSARVVDIVVRGSSE